MTKFFTFLVFTLSVISAMGQARNIDRKVDRYYHRAENALRKKDYINAMPSLRECVNLKPEEAKYAYMLGKCYVKTNRANESLVYFSSAYRNNPELDYQLNYYLGKAYHGNYRFDKAEEHLNAYLKATIANDPLIEDAQALLVQCANARLLMEHEKDIKMENLGEFMNSRYPEYNASFSDDYTWMSFTSRRPASLKKVVFGLHHNEDIGEQIFHSSYWEGQWSLTKRFKRPISKFGKNGAIYSSEDGNSLNFFAERGNGDVNIVERDGNVWSKPERVGAKINSKYNELSYFITSDKNTIYFASDRPGGIGGTDLYMTVKTGENTWSEPTNLGEALNSIQDETDPFVTPDGKNLYYSSKGFNSMGGYDVFHSTLNAEGTWGKPENLGYPINSVSDDIDYINRSDKKGFFLSSNRMGGYGDFDMYFGYPYKPDVVLTQVVGQLFDSLNNVGVNARVRLVDPETGEVVAESATDAQGNYNLGVPNGKNKKYNMDIKFAGVNPPKPAQKAVLGKENLLMGSVIDGVTGEALQATIDLLDPATGAILDNAITNKGSGKYFVPIKSGMEYQIRVKAPQYIAYFEKLQVSASGTFEAHNYEIALQRVNDANRIVLNWQFFDYGKWELNTLYSDDLDNLMIVMQKVPVLRIKIAGHTDWDGSPSYNQKLSEKRAQAVKEFLVKKGIDKSRIEVEGKGELQPLYDNENPNLKPWNRRVELFILN